MSSVCKGKLQTVSGSIDDVRVFKVLLFTFQLFHIKHITFAKKCYLGKIMFQKVLLQGFIFQKYSHKCVKTHVCGDWYIF
jgi:hypothetical protein